jgi:hypothetical protein
MAVDLGALATTSDTIYADETTAVSSAINLTGLLYLDVTVATSTGNTGNSITQRQGIAAPYASVATVFSGNTTTAASANSNLAGAASALVVSTDGSGNVQSSGTTLASLKMAGSTTEGQDGFWNNGMRPTQVLGLSSTFISGGIAVLGTGYVTQYVPDHNIVLGHAGFYVTTTQASNILYACVYTSTSSAAVWSASVAITGSGTNAIASATQYTLQAGTLYYLLVGQFGGATGGSLQAWAAQSTNAVTMLSGQGTWIGTAANGLSGAACPSTTGTITAQSGSVIVIPAVLFGP